MDVDSEKWGFETPGETWKEKVSDKVKKTAFFCKSNMTNGKISLTKIISF